MHALAHMGIIGVREAASGLCNMDDITVCPMEGNMRQMLFQDTILPLFAARPSKHHSRWLRQHTFCDSETCKHDDTWLRSIWLSTLPRCKNHEAPIRYLGWKLAWRWSHLTAGRSLAEREQNRPPHPRGGVHVTGWQRPPCQLAPAGRTYQCLGRRAHAPPAVTHMHSALAALQKSPKEPHVRQMDGCLHQFKV